MPDPMRNCHNFIGFMRGLDAVQIDDDVSVQNMVSFVLYVMPLLGMLLSRQNDHEALTVFTIDNGNRRETRFAESLHSIVMRDFKFALSRNLDFAFADESLHVADDFVDCLARVTRLQLITHEGAVFRNIIAGYKLGVLREVLRHQLTRYVRHSEEDVGGGDGLARCD